MKTKILPKNYNFFFLEKLPEPTASSVQAANAANGAANLGCPTVLIYPQQGLQAINPIHLLRPCQPQKPPESVIKYYNFQDKLQVVRLPMPWPIDHWKTKFTNSNTVATKYYFPFYIRATTKIVHAWNWNFIKAAIKYGIPAIYEHHHHEDKQFEPEIVNHPLFQVAVTVADTVRESMIQHGMPPEKLIKIHNGFNRLFMQRQPEKAAEWRQKLLQNQRSQLVVYAGALRKFKGIDILIDVAKQMPNVQFVCAGGEAKEVEHYQKLAQSQQVDNITFLGYVLHNELASLLQAADVLAHPHCSGPASTFTSPLKLFDYLASGNPIVATEIISLEEFKNTPAIAAWCEPDNPHQFAAALQKVLETHPKKADGYPEILEFVKQFSWENRAAKILSYVEERFLPPMMT
ncbi:glycosyl transferase family 1 [Nostoc sp. MBR 210]|nr:glycosyl transferase family 1 [Nostoc sp. MBR 210]